MPQWCLCGNAACNSAIPLCGAVPECEDCAESMAEHTCWPTQEKLEAAFPMANLQKYRIDYLYDSGSSRPWRPVEHLGNNFVYSDTFAEAQEKLAAILLRREGYEYRIVNVASGLEVGVTPDDEYPPGLERKRMVNVKFLRENGRLMLSVDSQVLHEILDSIGVQAEGEPAKYKDRPYTPEAVANVSTLALSTEVFLTKLYPAKFDLTPVFSKPPSMESLKKLAQSSYEQVRKILEHYQPIDIQVEIQKKVLKEAG